MLFTRSKHLLDSVYAYALYQTDRGRHKLQITEILIESLVNIINKNAFQWDAYRPVVDRILACTAQGGGCLSGGMSAQGVSPSGPGVCIPACNGADTPSPVDRQTLAKT